MKKTLLFLLLINLPVLIAQAQYLRYGAKAGGEFSSVKGDDGSSDYTEPLAGLHAGFVGSYEFVSRLAVQAELLYVQKGFTYDGYEATSGDRIGGDLRLHYMELPLLLKVQKGGLFAEAGPYAGYLLDTGTDFEVTPGFGIAPEQPLSYASDNINRFDYGYTAGLGIMLDNGFFMNFRYTGGLRSFSKELDQKNSDIRLSVGFLLAPPNPAEMMRR
jgi:hypothetical protein